jgi:hypothetical protein
VIALRLYLSLFAMERILPDRIAACAPRRAGGKRDVLSAVHFVDRGDAFGICLQLVLPQNGARVLVKRAQHPVLRVGKKHQTACCNDGAIPRTNGPGAQSPFLSKAR